MATQLIIVQAMDILFIQKFSSISDVNEGILSKDLQHKNKDNDRSLRPATWRCNYGLNLYRETETDIDNDSDNK